MDGHRARQGRRLQARAHRRHRGPGGRRRRGRAGERHGGRAAVGRLAPRRRRSSGRVDSDGKFAQDRFQAGTYYLWARHGEMLVYPPEKIEITDQDLDAEIELQPGPQGRARSRARRHARGRAGRARGARGAGRPIAAGAAAQGGRRDRPRRQVRRRRRCCPGATRSRCASARASCRSPAARARSRSRSIRAPPSTWPRRSPCGPRPKSEEPLTTSPRCAGRGFIDLERLVQDAHAAQAVGQHVMALVLERGEAHRHARRPRGWCRACV